MAKTCLKVEMALSRSTTSSSIGDVVEESEGLEGEEREESLKEEDGLEFPVMVDSCVEELRIFDETSVEQEARSPDRTIKLNTIFFISFLLSFVHYWNFLSVWKPCREEKGMTKGRSDWETQTIPIAVRFSRKMDRSIGKVGFRLFQRNVKRVGRGFWPSKPSFEKAYLYDSLPIR